MVKCENLSLSFSEEEVICENFSFQVKKGESVCISGPSGKGKTSILKILMGFLTPQSGKVFINDLELNPLNIKEIREQMVWLPQNVNLPVNSSQELVHLLQIPHSKIQVFDSFLDQLGISGNGKVKNFSELSGGQKQRIVLAACLSLEKPILLLDEPVSALDDHSIDLLVDVVGSLENTTMVSTSHNQKWLKHCGRILKL